MRLENGFGSIIKLSGKRRKPFAARITIGFEEIGLNDKGVMKYRQKFKYIGYFEKRTEALECLVKFNSNPYDISKHNITFSQIYEEWSSRKYDNISIRTKINYETAYKKCSLLYKIPFKDIKTKHLQRVIDDNKHLAMINIFKILFNQLFNYAIKNDIVDKNYSKFIEMPSKKKSIEKNIYTNDTINLLWENKDKDNVDIILILLYTGLRISELLELKNENINLEERYIFIEKSKTQAGIRNVPLHKKIIPFIEKRYSKNTYLIVNKKSRTGKSIPYSTFHKNEFANLKELLNLDHTIHETRHTFISQCDSLGLNIVATKRIIGHANDNVTQHYTKKSIEELVNIIDQFDY